MSAFAAAGIDVGTNSLLLTIARPEKSGRLLVLDERSVITRLGEGLGQRGALSEAAMTRSLAVLAEFGAAVKAVGAEARAVGTSALRRAEQGERFLERAQAALGFPLQILSGTAEARLGYRGALSDLPAIDPAQQPIVVDPGGGSTEVVNAGGLAVSFELGAVRLTETFLHSDPPTSAELTQLSDHARACFASLEPARDRPLVGVGGTATTLAALDLGLDRYDGGRVHGHRLSLDTIRALRERLASLPLRERETIPCLPPGRADIAIAGAFIIEALLHQLAVTTLTVSDRGLRFGLIAEIVAGWGAQV